MPGFRSDIDHCVHALRDPVCNPLGILAYSTDQR